MLLSRIRGFKEFTLVHSRDAPVKLPTHLFNCLDLKHLKLERSIYPLSFRGFPKLLTLDLHNNASIQGHRYGELIACCPQLETLKLWDSDLRGQVKLADITNLKNVKMLALSLCLLDNMTMLRVSTVFQHISLLPKLLELCLRLENCTFLPEDAQNPVSANFPFLKTLAFCHMDFSSFSMLSFAFRMLIGCTTLQTLFISGIYKNDVPLPAIFSPDRSTMGQLQLQLQKVRFVSIKGLENEVCLIKYILACSPMLKSIEIRLTPYVGINNNEKYKLASKLLKLRRASPMAEIILYS
uniref:uncharacterized protein LOC122597217 n=1 Tax=Erigeron canadensis TaxID=72917 RepID=UPI001CB97AF6|nr:uncharacterized protein LOC122597217 [Erigeron canadensis]